MEFKVAFGTDIGLKRSQNQDNAIVLPELGLFIVADGMGGHKGGEIASAIVVETVPKLVRQLEKDHYSMSANEIISKAISKANEAIYKRSKDDPNLNGMGTTTTALLFKDTLLTIGHVGDSRCYYFQPGQIWQLTRDHTLVQEKLRAGLISREQLKTDQMKNVLTRSVGFESQVQVETYEFECKKSDCFLICSDGLSGLVEDRQIQQIVQKQFFDGKNIENAVKELISAAKENGGDDNITCVLVGLI